MTSSLLHLSLHLSHPASRIGQRLALTITMRFLFPLLISVSALQAQEGPREWETELADRYSTYGSFVARYTGTAPAGQKIHVTLAEERESGSSLVRVTLNDRPMLDALHIAAGHPGAGLFISHVGEPRIITGLDGAVASLGHGMNTVRKIFGDKPAAKIDWYLVTNASFLNEALSGELRFQAELTPPWHKDKLTRPARTARVKKDTVHFPLPNGSFVAIHKESGLLASQQITRRGDKIDLRLLELKPLDGLAALKALMADLEWPENKSISIHETNLAKGIRKAGFQTMLNVAAESPFTIEQLEKRIAAQRTDLVQYWLATQGPSMRQKLTPRKVRALRGGLYPHFDKHKSTLAQPPKSLTFDSWLVQERPKIEAKLSKDLANSAYAKETRAEVRTWVDPIRGIDPDGAAKASLFLDRYFQAGSHAIARVMLDVVVEAGTSR